ncbi:Transcriptional regulator [Exophiala dermatitidis]|uniref:Transcriptional adapter 3 n=1 Tax=Exophiala dermatitidis (strain ATCC 34100 / CBS 525.76 / NIH/UT8656) TaxID=858893 RepID=H6BRM0_EXODN|nr:transcriptional adapter 3 [Exophiala dermatitidis NIH/UT8656]KAJ4507545.1 Transcriptional regulator [Exophiala dermatitidis]EHY54749.1 transcriptional adapter 3 [Exophiala dermatitidis NIH/UT8656]KAJ4517889.1 Transcriptional regulator [Exophiala dermatitidis]KAJ4521571.1 Transcriptional regulator [Exophiala dermatitidis]KAJ4533348.1 Transcriptional regulator [Exophiala dermatitidis]
MPPLGSGGKGKGKHQQRDARRSRSRNTTPSSVLSTGTTVAGPTTTPLLELETSRLLVSPKPNYSEIIDYLETHGTRLEPKSLHDIIDQLKHLSESAEKRAESCEKAIRLIHEQKKELESDQQHREREAEQARRVKARKEEAHSQKNPKAKKRKDRPETVDNVEIKREDEPSKIKIGRAIGTPGPVDSPSPSKKTKLSPGTSSLSEVADSPEAAAASAHASPTKSDVSMSDAEDNRIIHGPPPVPHQGFFPDPMAPDPAIYHIREVTPGMTDEEKKEIYGVTAFPTKDLSDEIAGTPPDKDFSNAKPTNQVAASTFLTYVEPYVRPLTEEDVAWLRERGDRVTPFLAVPRGKKSYQEIWAEEDGLMHVDNNNEKKLSPNEPRGSIEAINDDNLATDQVSTGPLAARLLSLLKFEHRSPANENANGTNDLNTFMATDGNDTMDLDGLTNGQDNADKPLAPAAAIAEQAGGKQASSQRLDYVQSEERIKGELRHLGLLGQDEEPDYDAHHDDDISERLRLLQAELRRVLIVNGARKARLLDLAKERLAYQEYSTIHEDLDSQVQQAYLKRTRTLGKTKKGGPGANKPRPGSHGAGGPGTAVSVNRARDIGDNARMLMDRRKRWENCIGPVFKDMKHGIPDKNTTIWDPKIMEAYEKAELEALEEEAAVE